MTTYSPTTITLLEKLVSFPTKSGDLPAATACLGYIAGYLKERSMSVKLVTHSNFPSLVATTQSVREPKLLLQAHLDVVPAPRRLYQMKERGGKLYGRGVYDMKFAAACYLQLVEDLKDELAKYDFGIMLTCDEEVGGRDGVGYLLGQGYGAEVCVLPDGGNDWQLESGCKGAWFIKLTAAGQATHGSRPWEGDNAIDKLAAGLHTIRKLFGELNEDRSSLAVSQIQGGQAINQVPAEAWATVDMRFVDQASYGQLRPRVEAAAAQAGLQMQTVAYAEACATDMKHSHVAEFIKITEEMRGQPLETGRSCGATDARYFTAKGIPTIVIRPTGGGAHGDGEWIDKAALLQFYDILKAYVTAVAKRQPK